MTTASVAGSASALPTPIAIIGAGRLGRALAAALRERGLAVQGPLGRGESPADAPVVVLCVPDAAIASVAAAVPAGCIVGHCSGVKSLQPLAPHEAFSLHPLLSISGERTTFDGAACAIDANSDRARDVAAQLASALGMRALRVPALDRPLYHAAASLAANYVVTLESIAARLFAEVGLERADFAPLVRSALEAWIDRGSSALTGPVSRGDEGTVAKQREAIATRAPEVLPLWDALTDATRSLVHP